jgi:hypothetical protein
MTPTTAKHALLLALAAMLITPTFAHEKGIEAGPNGGRLLKAVEPPLEFLVTKDRRVEITPLTAEHKPGKLAGQVISVVGGDRAKPTKLEFKEEGGKLVSTNALPEGNDFPISVSIKASGARKPVYEKFNINLEKCPDCKNPEYVCICAQEDAKKK